MTSKNQKKWFKPQNMTQWCSLPIGICYNNESKVYQQYIVIHFKDTKFIALVRMVEKELGGVNCNKKRHVISNKMHFLIDVEQHTNISFVQYFLMSAHNV